MARADLMALTDDGLVQLSSAGLVKRALRDLSEGKAPEVTESANGVIEARFADGTVTRLSAGQALGDADCTCPASGMCRHRVGLAIAYRASAAPDAAHAARAWDPATLDLAGLEAKFTGAARAELQRLRTSAVNIRLTYGVTPTAAFPMATVRFLAPNDAALARCDCAAGHSCVHVVLAVEAFKAASGATHVTIGASAGHDSLREAGDAVLGRLLTDGVIAGMAAHGTVIDKALRLASDKRATWFVLALEALAEQITAYEQRSAVHDEQEVLEIATELFARPRARNVASMGFGEAMETPMSKTRLASLGARVTARGRDTYARVAFFDTDTGATMLLERTFAATGPATAAGPTPAAAPTSPPAAVPAATRHIAPGLSLGAVARGQLLTAVAKRRADGTVRFGAGGGGKTTLLARNVTVEAPQTLAVRDLDTLRRALVSEPPRFLLPRNRTSGLRVFDIARCVGQAFEPGTQTWHAAVELADGGGELRLQRTYDAAAPGAIASLSGVFDGASGAIRQIAGRVSIVDGAVTCEPWAISADRLVVPDVDDVARIDALEPVSMFDTESSLRAARRFLAGAVHAGFQGRDEQTGQAVATAIAGMGFEVTGRAFQTWLAGQPSDVAAFGAIAIRLESTLQG